MQLFTPLTSIDSVACGPTQVVPQSHCAGRRPETQDRPHFDGNGPVSILAEPGDAYIFNNQAWHRGAPNASDRRRLLGGATYSKRFVAQRFYRSSTTACRSTCGRERGRACSGCSVVTGTPPTAESPASPDTDMS